MIRFLPRSIQGRLWVALAILSLAILGISGLTWAALHRVDARLQDLHRQSLSQVAQAIDLSKRTSDLATSAPYLLSQRSNFLIELEGQNLSTILQRVREQWPEVVGSDTKRAEIFPLTFAMENAIRDLVAASRRLDEIQAQIRGKVAVLSSLREEAMRATEDVAASEKERLNWWSLQSMNSDALNAAYADNLIGVGEEQRHFQRQNALIPASELTKVQNFYLDKLAAQVSGQNSLFELRRIELGAILAAQNALFRIRRDANQVNELATVYAREAEAFLTRQRSASSSTIQLTRLSVASISLLGFACALAAALFVSRYVAFNIGRVSEAMVRLANGDRSSVLPRKIGGADEISDLFRSFRSFRANALRLDRSHRELNQRNALFEKVFANISDGMATTDATGRLTATNPAFDHILCIGHAHQTMTGTFVAWLGTSKFAKSAMDSGVHVSHRGYLELTAEDGQVLELRASRLPDEGRVWLLSDVTEQRKITARLDQIDRIETLGKLAGDTAHDFGNILSTIRTHAHLLNTSDGSKAQSHIAAIENAVEFGASLTERLLAFARKQPLVPEVVDLNDLLAGMIELMEIGLKSGVSIDVVYGKDALPVLADPGQLESAILNLVLNANNAMRADGIIRIHICRDGSDNVIIKVADTGIGMSEDVVKKAIEPFFTTRSGDGGTGLGLSIVYGFINQTGGTMSINSIQGQGTTVQISLPTYDGSPVECHRPTGTALLVDDNPKERAATEAALMSLGFQTTSCGSVSEAKDALCALHYDLIVSDFDLGPGPTGLELLEESKERQPGTRHLLVSGKVFSDQVMPKNICFLEKPVSRQALASLI
ncbi:MAG: ATP-binding protein [Roseobacter sp.]